MWHKRVILGCVFLIPFGCVAADTSAPQGFLEGHLQITFLGAAHDPDEMPRSAVGPETYAEYPLIILSQNEKKEVARIIADEKGDYRAALPPGIYILDVQGRAARRLRARPQQFTIVSNQSIRVDMTIIIGFH